MREMMTGSHLDYFTASYVQIKSPSELNFLHEEFQTVETVRPMPHYDLAWKLDCGATVNIAHGELQGARIDFTGQALEFTRRAGIPDNEVIAICTDPAEFKQVTRMDYCWDIANAGSVRHVSNHWEAGKCKTRLRGKPSGYVKYGSRAGRTVYFGSNTSSQKVRVYDKGHELKLLNKALLRVELQVRKPHAQAMYIDTITSNLAIAARSRIKALLDFPKLQWWQQLLSGETKELSTVPRKQPKFQAWLLGQVTSAIIKHHEVNAQDDREVIDQWLKNLSTYLAPK